MLSLLPASAVIERGQLRLGGLAAAELADRFGTPLVVYCERTLRERARLFRAAAPDSLVVYGTKAFPNVALLALFAEEGLGADVSTLGELVFAQRAGISGERLIVHGNNKSDEELAAAARSGGTVVLDSLDEVARAAAAGVARVLVRVTPGVETDTHEAIRTGHHGSKFGLAADDALEAVRQGLAAGLDVAGLHVHVGSQLADVRAHVEAIELLADLALRCRDEFGWTARIVDVGGGFGVRHVPGEAEPDLEHSVPLLAAAVPRAWIMRGLPPPQVAFEPGRALVGRAGVTLYRVGTVKRANAIADVAVDGGMSDNPRPQLYDAAYTALLASRAEEPPAGEFRIVGKHCESGDVLIERIALPEPRRGDVLAVPATGAYTLGMASNYNGVPRPAAVLVGDGEARVILRRESVDDLLAREIPAG